MDFNGGDIFLLVIGLIAAVAAIVILFIALVEEDGSMAVGGFIAAVLATVFLIPAFFMASHRAANNHAAQDLKRSGYKYVANIATDYQQVTFAKNNCRIKIGLYNVASTFEVFTRDSGGRPHAVTPSTVDQMLALCTGT